MNECLMYAKNTQLRIHQEVYTLVKKISELFGLDFNGGSKEALGRPSGSSLFSRDGG